MSRPIPPLVAQASHGVGEGSVVGHDHAAFAGRDLLVRIEGEDCDVAEAAQRPPVDG